MCRPESVKRWRTPSALSMRTRSCAPVAVPMQTSSIGVELADRDRAGDAPGTRLHARFVRRLRSRAIEYGSTAAGRDEPEREMRQLVSGIQRHVLGSGGPRALQGDTDHQDILQRT